jgi:hypothetical protein
MRTSKLWLIQFSSACLVFSALAQGNFRNLNFESANLSPVPPGQFGGLVPSSNAIPGWSAFLGTNQVTQVLQNNLTLGNASVDILGPNWSLGGIIEGQYTVVLQPGAGGGAGTNISASIAQTGLVPASTESLQLKVSAFSSFSVNLGGQDLSLVLLGTGSNYSLYGANVPSFAGQVEQLTITALAAPNTANYFDSIVFSSNPIPEPSVVALSIFFVLTAAFRLWSARKTALSKNGGIRQRMRQSDTGCGQGWL